MGDNDLIRLFRPIIIDGLTSLGYTEVPVLQANQPTQQGVVSSPAVYFYKVVDKRYGFLGREDKWDEDLSQMGHTESQWYETTFQISAYVQIDVNSLTQYTASDLVNSVAAIMQSDRTRAILMQEDVGILRVMEVRNPYFIDDKDQFEASPSFDFVLTHQQILKTVTPVVETVELDIYRI